jgi:hypothetical protein
MSTDNPYGGVQVFGVQVFGMAARGFGPALLAFALGLWTSFNNRTSM